MSAPNYCFTHLPSKLLTSLAKLKRCKAFYLQLLKKQAIYHNMQNSGFVYTSAEELQQVICTYQKRTWLPLYLS